LISEDSKAGLSEGEGGRVGGRIQQVRTYDRVLSRAPKNIINDDILFCIFIFIFIFDI
jgi:hypothetical protein